MLSFTNYFAKLKEAITNNNVEAEEYYKNFLLAFFKATLTRDGNSLTSLLTAIIQDDQESINENVNSILNNRYEMPDNITEIPGIEEVYGGKTPQLIKALKNDDRNEILQTIENIEASRTLSWSDAIEDNDKDKILELIDSGEDINQFWLHKYTNIPVNPLLAAMTVNLDIASMLLEHGADPSLSVNHMSPHEILLDLNRTDKLQEFVDAGADINYQENNKRPTLLTAACKVNKSLDTIRDIISSGADVNLGMYLSLSDHTTKGLFPLRIACAENSPETVRQLIASGGDVAKVNPLPVDDAFVTGYDAIIELVKAGAKITQLDVDKMSGRLDWSPLVTLSDAAELSKVIYGNDGNNEENQATDNDAENNQNNPNQEDEEIGISEEDLNSLIRRVNTDYGYKEHKGLMIAQFKAKLVHDPSANISKNPLYKSFASLMNKELAEDDNLKTTIENNLKTYIRENIKNPTLKKQLLEQFSGDNFSRVESFVRSSEESSSDQLYEGLAQYDIYSKLASGLKVLEGNFKTVIEKFYQSTWQSGEKNITAWTKGEYEDLDALDGQIIKSNFGKFTGLIFIAGGGAEFLQNIFADEIASKLNEGAEITESEREVVLNWENIQHEIKDQAPLAEVALKPMLENDQEKIKAAKNDIFNKLYNKKENQEKLTEFEKKFTLKNTDTLIEELQLRDREAEEEHIPGASARLGLEEDSSDDEESNEVEAYDRPTIEEERPEEPSLSGLDGVEFHSENL